MSRVPKVDIGYPKRISEEFKGIPDRIDAAFTWRKNNNIYFFKGSKYWRFDYELARAGMRGLGDAYPKNIETTWNGIPNNIDAVNTWKDGRTYFFKGDDFYKISDDIQVRYFLASNFSAKVSLKPHRISVTQLACVYLSPLSAPRDSETIGVAVSVCGQMYPDYPRSTAVDWFGCPPAEGSEEEDEEEEDTSPSQRHGADSR